MAMRDYSRWFAVLALGALWGLGELVIWWAMGVAGLGMKSPVVAGWGLLNLAVARTVMDKPGTSALMGLVAASYKLIAGLMFPCAFTAIMAMAIAFDIATSLSGGARWWIRVPLAAVSVYFSFAGFALVAAYGLKMEFWAAGGLANVLRYTLVNGSWAALISLFTVGLGFGIGKLISRISVPFWVPAAVYGMGWFASFLR